MSDQLDRLEVKIDKMVDKLSEHSSFLAVHATLHNKNSKDLEEHIKRTDLLEKELHDLWKWKWLVAGGLAIASALSPIISPLILKFITGGRH